MKPSENVEVVIQRAKCCIRLGDSNSAERTIKEYLEANSSHFLRLVDVMDALKQLRDVEGRVKENFDKKDYQSCLNALNQGLGIAPECLDFALKRLECLILLKRHKEATPTLQKLLIAKPRIPELYFLDGMIAYFCEFDLQTALKRFSQALALDPDYKKAKDMHTKCKLTADCQQYALDGNSEMLREASTKALVIEIDLCPNSWPIISLNLWRAEANFKLGHLRDAIGDATSVLLIDPCSVDALEVRAQCYSALFEFSASISDFEAALKITKDKEKIKEMVTKTLGLQKEVEKPIEYYDLLHVPRNATFDEIKESYKRLALVHHPDKHTNSPDRTKAWNAIVFKQIGKAYTILSDPFQRWNYEKSLKESKKKPEAPTPTFFIRMKNFFWRQ